MRYRYWMTRGNGGMTSSVTIRRTTDFATVAEAEAAMKDLISHGDPRDGWNVAWRVEEVMETYLIAEVLNTGDWGIIEEFQAKDDEAANAYADEHYSHIEWYVLYQSTHVNIND